MKKLVVMVALILSVLAIAGVASAEHGDIGGIKTSSSLGIR